MRKILIWAAILAPCVVSQSARSQSIMETGGMQAGAAGLGAGMAASMGHGKLLTRSYDAARMAEQSVAYQTKVIEQYVAMGYQYEAKKQWENAEKAYRYALQVVARRDGPGSDKTVPILKHLVRVNTAQNDLGEAITLQKMVLQFTKNAKAPDPEATAKDQMSLGSLYMKKQDFSGAEPYVRDSAATYDAYPSLPNEQRIKAKQTYATVLRELHRDDEASAIESSIREVAAKSPSVSSPATTATRSQPVRNSSPASSRPDATGVTPSADTAAGTSAADTTAVTPSAVLPPTIPAADSTTITPGADTTAAAPVSGTSAAASTPEPTPALSTTELTPTAPTTSPEPNTEPNKLVKTTSNGLSDVPVWQPPVAPSAPATPSVTALSSASTVAQHPPSPGTPATTATTDPTSMPTEKQSGDAVNSEAAAPVTSATSTPEIKTNVTSTTAPARPPDTVAPTAPEKAASAPTNSSAAGDKPNLPGANELPAASTSSSH